MMALVDAGPLVRVAGASPRDCARLGMLAAEDRAKFPIDVYLESGDVYRFIESEPRETTTKEETRKNVRPSRSQKAKPAAH
ncbi:MAG TPA: hypothetical protein VJN64_15130 [Terriglobales bacterium]|nr:hypothetical protein [Terriglobales bacterium]